MRRRRSRVRIFLVLALAVPAALMPALVCDAAAMPVPIPDPSGRFGGTGSGGDGADPDVFDVNAPVYPGWPGGDVEMVRDVRVPASGRCGWCDAFLLSIGLPGMRQLVTRI